jgi:hypothetical protein
LFFGDLPLYKFDLMWSLWNTVSSTVVPVVSGLRFTERGWPHGGTGFSARVIQIREFLGYGSNTLKQMAGVSWAEKALSISSIAFGRRAFKSLTTSRSAEPSS